MTYSAYEKETHICCNDETKLCTVYSLQSNMITRLKKAGYQPSKVDADGAHHFRDIPQSKISFRSTSVAPRKPMSEERRLAASERLKKAREKK